ncbi:ankyrin repeat-containing domain protein [Podospora aff. communis PSN243]|uniref:Ankyrin repeat-containing domain protein n=1 Tax=Podospora aff. communis PSN243 TaxID=3040156 RepID=A0AAV9GQ67_9PEZI|nr:ankyrin repeat-containing domain protein [Podospora aff. communis PSN243]
MLAQHNTGIDWEQYNADVIQYYVEQKNTAEATIEFLRHKYGLNVTLSQFKKKFSQSKNIPAELWKGHIIPSIKKRQRENKPSDVFFDGRPVGAKRVMTAMSRYSTQLDFGAAATEPPIGVERIRIATPNPPSPPSASPPSPTQQLQGLLLPGAGDNFSVGIERSHHLLESRESVQMPIDGTALSTVIQTSFEDYDESTFTGGPPDSFDEVFDMHHAGNWLAESPPPAVDNFSSTSFIFHQGNVMTGEHFNDILTSALSPRSLVGLTEHGRAGWTRVKLAVNLPWFQLTDLIELSKSPPRLNRSFNPTSSPRFTASSSLSSWEDRISTTATANNQGDHVSFATHTLSAAFIKLNFPERVQELIPGRGGEVHTTGSLFDFQRGLSVQQTLCVAAYLSSNNLLSKKQTENFLQSVAEYDYLEELKAFLRLDTWSTRVFGLKLVEAAARAKDINLLRQMHLAGATFNHAAELIMRLDDAEILDLVIPTLDSNLLQGESGGRLLRSIATTAQVKVAKTLIQSGADLNMSTPTTPLWEAVQYNRLAMVELLVRAGADVNRHNATRARDTCWPLGVAVRNRNLSIVKCLIKHGAKVENVRIHNTPLIDYAEKWALEAHSILLSSIPHQKELVGVKEIISAASSAPSIFTRFADQHQDVDNFGLQLEKALIHALRTDATKAATSLLNYGVNPDTPLLQADNSTKHRRHFGALDAVLDAWGAKNKHLYTKLLLGYKVSVNTHNWLISIFADESYDPRLLRLLVDAGFNLEAHGPEGMEFAIKMEILESVPLLLELGAPLDEFGERATPLQTAARSGQFELVQLLLARGAALDKEAYPLRGYTAMQGAAMSGKLALVKLLHGLGATLNDKPALVQGVTSLEAAVRPWEEYWEPEPNPSNLGPEIYEGDIDDVVTYLLDEGAKVNRDDGAPSPLLHDLIERGNFHLLRRVVEAGAKLECRWGTLSSNYSPRTPLQLAAEMNQLEAVEILLDHGAEINAHAATERGRTALQAASASEDANLVMIELLLQKGADVNAPAASQGGVTALQAAAIRGHINIAMRLLEENADANAPRALRDGRMAIDGAAEHGRLDMVKMLINADAMGALNGQDGFKEAIRLARENDHDVVADYLEQMEGIESSC